MGSGELSAMTSLIKLMPTQYADNWATLKQQETVICCCESIMNFTNCLKTLPSPNTAEAMTVSLFGFIIYSALVYSILA